MTKNMTKNDIFFKIRSWFGHGLVMHKNLINDQKYDQ